MMVKSQLSRVALTTLVAALLCGPLFAQTTDYHDIAARFFELVKEKKPGEAVDYAFATNPWLEKVPDQVANVRVQFSGLESLVGQYIDQEILIDAKISSRYAYVYYLVAYERQPIKIEFHFYRPKDKWVLLNFFFNADISADVPAFAAKGACDPPD